MMDLWIAKAMADNINLTGEVLRQKWTTLANLARIPKDKHLTLSEGWLTRFKARHGLKELKHHGEAASANPEVVIEEQCHIQMLIKEQGYQLRDIFNMDERDCFMHAYHSACLIYCRSNFSDQAASRPGSC
jgi:Tc5 transposase DNA-binding domain